MFNNGVTAILYASDKDLSLLRQRARLIERIANLEYKTDAVSTAIRRHWERQLADNHRKLRIDEVKAGY